MNKYKLILVEDNNSDNFSIIVGVYTFPDIFNGLPFLSYIRKVVEEARKESNTKKELIKKIEEKLIKDRLIENEDEFLFCNQEEIAKYCNTTVLKLKID
jgi:hypothetical protein